MEILFLHSTSSTSPIPQTSQTQVPACSLVSMPLQGDSSVRWSSGSTSSRSLPGALQQPGPPHSSFTAHLISWALIPTVTSPGDLPAAGQEKGYSARASEGKKSPSHGLCPWCRSDGLETTLVLLLIKHRHFKLCL